MTDLPEATRFPADQTENGKRKKEKKPTFSVTTCQSKHQGSGSGEDFGPETPRLYYFFSRSLWLKRRGGGWVFGGRSVLLLFCSKEVKLLIVEIAWRREHSHPPSEELHLIWAAAGRAHARAPGSGRRAALCAVNGKVGGSPREGSTVP